MAELQSRNIDLHTHTVYSDGDLSPSQLLQRARLYGLAAVAITDHDTVAAYTSEGDVVAEAKTLYNLQLIPGVELSTSDPGDGKYHILGLSIDPGSAPLRDLLRTIAEQRASYTEAVCNRLREAGWQVDATRLLSSRATPTKAHIARALLDRRENAPLWQRYTGSAQPTEGQLIEATLIEGMPFYIAQPEKIHSQDAIDAIHSAGGVAIVAHPAFNIMHGESLTVLCDRFLARGIDGFEGIYIQYDRSNPGRAVEYRKELAEYCMNHNLLMTGGSDFHTDNEQRLGEYIDLGFHNHPWKVPYELLGQIEEHARQYRH